MLYPLKINIFTVIELIRGVAPGSASARDQRVVGSNPTAPTIMKNKAKIYKPTKSSMQSGLNKTKKWILEYFVENKDINPLMGWESSSNTSLKLSSFSKKDDAIEYAKK